MTTYTKSVSLVTGEKFVLPPGAILKGSSDNNAFTSTCPIPTLETLACYVSIFAANKQEDDTGFFEGDQVAIIGYRLNGSDTLFATPFTGSDPDGYFELSDLGEALQTAIPAIISSTGDVHGDATRGRLSYLLIQTIPSVALNLELLFRGTAPLDAEPQGNTAAISRVPFRLRSLVVADDYEGVPECPTTELEA